MLRQRRLDFMRYFKALKLGMIGFSAVGLINLMAFFFLKIPSARWFSSEWWISWFPGYAVWIVLLLVGIGQQLQARK
jgi:hypothetical protein